MDELWNEMFGEFFGRKNTNKREPKDPKNFYSDVNNLMDYYRNKNVIEDNDFFIDIFGDEPEVEIGDDWEKRTWNSKDGTIQFTSFTRVGITPEDFYNQTKDSSESLTFKEKFRIINKRKLQYELEKAVENEEFELACELRDKLKEYK